MSSRPRKRTRPVSDDNRADCPFTVTAVAAPSYEKRDYTLRQKKRDGRETSVASRHGGTQLIQVSPFAPRGRFKSDQSMNLMYTVEPQQQWLDMTRYNSFVLNGYKYAHDEFVYIANDTTIELEKTSGKNADGESLLQSTHYWVARILEVRASDELHVYARIYWMYSPDELPPGTVDGKKIIAGRQPYHGHNELIASNHMDVINVVSVAMKATVHQWIESDDEEVQDALYWRQAFNYRTSQVSSVELTCKCKTPANPDKTLVGCTNSKCGNWLHYECLLHEALMHVYDRLGTELPHKSEKEEESIVKLEDEQEREHETELPLRPLTPTENKEEENTPSAIDVEGSEHTRLSSRRSVSTANRSIQTPTPGPSNPVSQRSGAKSRASTKNGRGRKLAEEKPYQGLYQATLRMKEGPMAWEITDLRPNIQGGDRTWTERAACLVCQHLID